MANSSRVVFHEKLKAVQERFGRDLELEGLDEARRADAPVRRIHYLLAGAMVAGLVAVSLVLIGAAMVGLNAVLTGAAGLTTDVANQPFIRNNGLSSLVQGSNGGSRMGYWLVGLLLLLAMLALMIFGSPITSARRFYDRLVRLFSPPFTRRPYAVFVRRAQKTDAPGPLDLSVAGEAKFAQAFARIGPTACVGTNHVPSDNPSGTARIVVQDRDTLWTDAVDALEADAAFVAIDITDPTDRVLAHVREIAEGVDGPRFGILIALGTPERRMQSWQAVAKAIIGTPARVSPVAPKAPPCVMLIDGTIWTARGQAPHAQGAAQLSVTLADPETQALFDVVAGR
ncbi:MAG: hypothetical protein AAFQ18_09915 [Pseudomonadota bacterium]